MCAVIDTNRDLLAFCGENRYAAIYADPPWWFQNRTGKVAPEHRRLSRYHTMTLADIEEMPVNQIMVEKAYRSEIPRSMYG